MSEVRLSAEARTEFGKGGARRTRRAGKIPAVIYGHGADPRHVSLPAREFTNAVRHGGTNVLLYLDLDGEEQLAIPKAIQRHALKGTYDHVDLLAVRLGETVTIDVPLVVSGDIAPGGLLDTQSNTVSIEAEATHLPTEIVVSIDGLAIGAQVTAADLVLPTGSTLATDPTHVMLIIQEAPTEAEIDAEMAEAAEELGIVEDAADSEAAAEGEGGEAPAASAEGDAETSAE
ncbi:MAG TPA: 50S ribosomal protein L25/general stress protein Ctc [Jatrophihabitantaceae bacterium]|nr:50S ribosomal protein L25/general stress protein Ctc [Jatrophihabitantaceae bacterium]